MDLILVDENDVEIGVSEKHSAHNSRGSLHRSFSVLLFNDKKELLIQQRSSKKYHTPLRWTNTCCSHPMPGESVKEAVERRLIEELGASFLCFVYRAELDNDMVEHEYDHVFLGICNNEKSLRINHDEIADINWVSVSDVCNGIEINAESYTPWFIIMTKHLPKILFWLDGRKLSRST